MIQSRPGLHPHLYCHLFDMLRRRIVLIVEKTFLECICPNLEIECKMVCIGNKWKSFEKELEAHKAESIDSRSISAEKHL